MSSKRCSCTAISTGLKCKIKTRNIYRGKYVCHIHSNILFNRSILLIQKIYIGYRTRQKFKIIFIRLPTDLQKRVLWYMRESLYIKRYHNVITKILDKKTTFIFITLHENTYDFFLKIINIYNLYTKYISITTEESTERLYNLQDHFIYRYRNYLTREDDDDYDTIKNQLFESLKTFKNTYVMAHGVMTQ